MKLVKLFPLLLLLLSAAAYSDDTVDDERFRPSPWQISAKIGVTVSAPSSIALPEKRFPLFAGASLDYFSTRVIGFFVAPEIVSRGFRQSSGDSSATFLDLMAGLSVRLGQRWFTGASVALFRVSGFYSQPLENFSGPLSTPFSSTAQGFFGLSFAQDILFPVSENFKLGFSVGGKAGLSDAVSGTGVKFYEADLSFLAAFR